MNKLIFILLPILSFAQNDVNPCEKISKLSAIIKEFHYQSKPIDDSLSKYVFDTFLNELDEDHRLFTAVEINNLKKNYYTIDDSILEKNCSFISTFYTSYNLAIERYKTTLEEFKKTPFEYKSNETVQFSHKTYPYAKDEKELKNLFKKRILFNLLKDVSEKSKNKDSLLAHFDKIAKESKDKTFDYYFCQYSKLKITEKDFFSKFLNVFCSYFDPHTMYLSQSDKTNFLSNVSSDDFSFGMMVSLNEKDELLVDDIIPGSSAYYSEKIEDSDQIIKIKYLNDEYEIGCTSMDKISEIFSSSNYKSAQFTFRKKNGEIFTLDLTKKLMKIYENNVYSYILQKDNKKTGYIKIPSFYAVFENGKTNVSEDVAKEIYKLQAEKIEGLIIDLQNNGGGSMQEAFQLIGSFIDIGPIAIMNKNNEKQIIKDPNRGSIYSGPIIVLINGFSASASELFANAMQDYQRAIVIGNQSFGKASMQQILPLTEDNNNDEFIKITTDKFHNITGKTNQYIGITPDVEIPSLFNKQMPRESDSKTALKNDTIEGVIRFTKFNNPNRETAIQKSKESIKTNENLKKIDSLNEKINILFENETPPILLQFNSVFDYVNKLNLFWKDLKETTEIKSGIEVQKNLIDVDYQKYDEFLKSTNIERIKEIKTNLHILEACLIINNLSNNK